MLSDHELAFPSRMRSATSTQREASSHLLNGQRNAVHGGHRTAHLQPQDDPLFEDFLWFLATSLQRGGLRPNAFSSPSMAPAGKDGQDVIDQLRTVDKARLAQRLGMLEPREAATVLEVLREFFAP
jgi:hypothetical protein